MTLLEQIKKGESKILEFKKVLPSSEKISKTIISFANMNGGKILVGITKDGGVKGLDDADPGDYADRLANIVHDMIHPVLVPEIYSYEVNNKTIIVVEIYPSNTKPHFLKSKGKLEGTYIRVGATNKQADFDYIKELERQRLNISYDEDINRSFSFESFDTDMLIKILEKNLNKSIAFEDLVNFKLIKVEKDRKYFTNAALIIMGKLDHAKIRCARFKGDTMDVFIDQKDLSGDIFTQLENAMKFLLFNINLHGEIGPDYLRRVDTYEIPPDALREALINALIHRDYVITGADIKIAVFDNTIEITSPGAFPRGITIEEILRGRSEIRNRVIARIFREAELIEQWGRGIKRIIQQCEAHDLRTPEIAESGMFVQFVFHRNNRTLDIQQVVGTVNEEQKPDAKTGRKNRTQKPDNYKNTHLHIKRIMNYLKNNKFITVSDAMNVLGLARSRTSEILGKMVKEDLIAAVGKGKATKYTIK